jgi:hypothetical protein
MTTATRHYRLGRSHIGTDDLLDNLGADLHGELTARYVASSAEKQPEQDD